MATSKDMNLNMIVIQVLDRVDNVNISGFE
jgi:hypothetical protein